MNARILPFCRQFHQFQAGSLAYHPDLGYCEVLQVSGRMRTVSYDLRSPEPIPADEDVGTILVSESITAMQAQVDVTDLRPLPEKIDPTLLPLSRRNALPRVWHRPPTTRFTRGPGGVSRLPVLARCPVGALVKHPMYGMAVVMAVDNEWRTIEYEVREPDLEAEDGESISCFQCMVLEQDLHWIRPDVELAAWSMPDRRRGTITQLS